MRRLLSLVLASAALLAVAPAAQAADIVGVTDQKPSMFTSPFFRALDVKVSRLIVSYDAVLRGTFERADIDAWMVQARLAKIEPLISFGHARGCYDGEGIVKKKECRLPTVARFAKAFEAFRRRYPDVRVYSPWNEINHKSQPTAKNPKRAAEFYNLLKRRCRGCKVVAADILDQPGMAKYVKAFQKHVRGKPRIWGLHNYQDTNDYKTSGTRRMLRLVKGEIWLTETGGIVQFGRRRPYNPTRAAKATRFMFKLAGSNKRITRLYIYNWTGVARTERFDAGLTHPNGLPRPAYFVVRARLKKPGGNPSPAPVGAPGPPTPTRPNPRPTPTPAPTQGPSPTPAPPSPSPSPTPTESPTPTPTPTPIIPTPTSTPSPSPTPEPTAEPSPTPTATVCPIGLPVCR